MTAPCCF